MCSWQSLQEIIHLNGSKCHLEVIVKDYNRDHGKRAEVLNSNLLDLQSQVLIHGAPCSRQNHSCFPRAVLDFAASGITQGKASVGAFGSSVKNLSNKKSSGKEN